MKEIIKHSEMLEGTDIFFENVFYEFTDKEKELIIELLPERKWPEGTKLGFEDIKGHPKEAVEMFFMKIEFACNWLFWMENAPTRQDHRDKLEDMLKSFKQTLKFLKQIWDSRVYITLTGLREFNFDDSIIPSFSIPMITAKASVKHARLSEKHLEILIKIIETSLEPKRAPGAPSSYTAGFAKIIACDYRLCFEIMPTKYIDGHFARLIRELFLMINMEKTDCKRALFTAVDFVKKAYPE